ncbi:hypothetical protein Cgig2_001158 [Carnegiea gigantea]|uniref:Uncharacterized protein n=1 Tax=Carnegiea gigantea TaxID=171969 RepID=A0A9Q1K480_9CARY|nr:hypothetical protein Cgig2_001158 [Carnegiea gigantea]
MGLMLEIRRPISHWKKNNLVLEPNDGGLVLCNPDKQEIKDLKFQSCSWCVKNEGPNRGGCDEEGHDLVAVVLVGGLKLSYVASGECCLYGAMKEMVECAKFGSSFESGLEKWGGVIDTVEEEAKAVKGNCKVTFRSLDGKWIRGNRSYIMKERCEERIKEKLKINHEKTACVTEVVKHVTDMGEYSVQRTNNKKLVINLRNQLMYANGGSFGDCLAPM